MDQLFTTITDILIDYGYWGMFIAAFIAGSVFPFSSEAVMAGLQLAGLAPLPLFIWGTVGNVVGSQTSLLHLVGGSNTQPGAVVEIHGTERRLDGCTLFPAYFRKCHCRNHGIYARQYIHQFHFHSDW